GLAQRCPSCQAIIFRNTIQKDYICPKCKNHLQFPARERIEWLVDSETFQEWDNELTALDPLDFPGYQEKLNKSQKATALKEAVITGSAEINHLPFAVGVMDSRFIMASMGTVVGEKLTRLFEKARKKKLPVVLFIASGGARMHEGILSLMQMAKVTQAISRHSEAGLFYCSILTHPTTGGVTASFAMQGDVTLAEPKAIVGFAGKRVIEQTIKSSLPKDFQSAETVLKNGFIDKIIPRPDQKDTISLLLSIHQVRD
ncbi:MAG: acetyl-CoA carboxylase, carboxyltransferase subunit beta, partial [Atopostipes suicloacalis]|nr:acetyl-CoA carboxylase, carboxyltransferase subunit beta [Atopostipes suicloacalis]